MTGSNPRVTHIQRIKGHLLSHEGKRQPCRSMVLEKLDFSPKTIQGGGALYICLRRLFSLTCHDRSNAR